MDRTTVTRWVLATLIFVGIAWASVNYGLGWGRALLIAGLLIVFFFGGTSKHRSKRSWESTPESESGSKSLPDPQAMPEIVAVPESESAPGPESQPGDNVP